MQRPRHLHLAASLPRERAFWLGLSVLLVGQLIAFWMVCTQQVRIAQVRHENEVVETTAVRECMRSMPDATLARCMQRVAPRTQQDVAIGRPATAQTSAQPPVNSVYE